MPVSLRDKPMTASNPWGAFTGGNVDTDWTTYFGEGRYPQEPRASDQKFRSTWNLPQNLKGRNKFLQDTLELSAMWADSWLTQVAMPMEYTDATSVSWSTYEFAPKFADLVPERGVARLVRSARREGSATFDRRGIGFLLTHGFMHTEEGREQYRMNLEQIAQSVIETNNFQVLYAYLTCDDLSKERYRRFGNLKDSNKTMKDVLAIDIDYWDIFKKKKNGGEILDAMVTEQMNTYQGKADIWIMPSKIGMWYSSVPPNKTEYWQGGPKAIETLADGVDGFRTFGVGQGSSRVYLARTYDVDSDGPIDVLRFPAQIGEFHAMFDQQRGTTYNGYSSKNRSIMVFDEDGDRFAEISLSTAIAHMNRHDANGKLIPIDDKSNNLLYNPAYEKREVESDFMHFRDDEGKLQVASFFGNIKYDSRDIKDWSETLFRALDLLLPTPINATNNARSSAFNTFKKGIDALNLIEKIRYSDRVGAFLTALITPEMIDAATENNGETGNIAPSVPLLELVGNEYGGLNLPESQGFALPPFFGNWPGFETIANVSREGKAADLGYNETLFKNVEEFVNLLEDLAQSLEQILPGNPALDPKLSSSWFRTPSAACTLFENLIGQFRHPIFVSGGGGGGGERATSRASSRASSRIGAGINDEGASDGAKQDVAANFKTYVDTTLKAAKVAVEEALAAKDDLKFDSATLRALEQAKAFIDVLESGFVSESLRDVVEEGKAHAILAYALSQLKLYVGEGVSNKQIVENAKAIAGLINDTIANNVTAPAGTAATILTSTDIFIGDVQAFYTSNPGLYRRKSAPSRIADSLLRVVGSIDKLKEKSVDAETAAEESAFAVGVEGSRARKAATGAVRAFDSASAVRAPLTISPLMFSSYFDALKAGKTSSFMPASLDNPDVPINATEYAEHAGRVRMNVDTTTMGEVHASLRPLRIGANVGTASADLSVLGMVSNMVHKTNNGSVREVRSRARPSANRNTYTIGTQLDVTSRAMQRRMAAQAVGAERSRSRHTQRHVAAHGDADLMDTETLVGGARGNAYSNMGLSDGLDSDLIKQLNAPVLRQQFLAVEKSAKNDLYKMLQKLFLLTPTDERNFFALQDNDVMVPIDFLVFRPHARYQTFTVIKAKSGSDTGVTYFGNSHFVLGDDAKTHVHTGSYMYYSAAVVKNSKNVYVVRNAFVDGYDGGMGVNPYVRGSETYNPAENKYQSADPRVSGSIFVAAMPFGSTANLMGPISLTGKFHTFDESVYDVADEALHYNTAVYYNKFWGWLTNARGDEDLLSSDWRYINKWASPNVVMHQGHTFYWSQVDENFTGVRYGTGHWPSETVYPGCGKVRAGTYDAFKLQDYSTGFHYV